MHNIVTKDPNVDDQNSEETGLQPPPCHHADPNDEVHAVDVGTPCEDCVWHGAVLSSLFMCSRIDIAASGFLVTGKLIAIAMAAFTE
jgi:hypothetical protein